MAFERWSRRVSVRAASMDADMVSVNKGLPSGSETRRKGRPVITGQASPLLKAITFSLTRDRVFGEDQIA
jgi:hypothetical protein